MAGLVETLLAQDSSALSEGIAAADVAGENQSTSELLETILSGGTSSLDTSTETSAEANAEGEGSCDTDADYYATDYYGSTSLVQKLDESESIDDEDKDDDNDVDADLLQTALSEASSEKASQAVDEGLETKHDEDVSTPSVAHAKAISGPLSSLLQEVDYVPPSIEHARFVWTRTGVQTMSEKGIFSELGEPRAGESLTTQQLRTVAKKNYTAAELISASLVTMQTASLIEESSEMLPYMWTQAGVFMLRNLPNDVHKEFGSPEAGTQAERKQLEGAQKVGYDTNMLLVAGILREMP